MGYAVAIRRAQCPLLAHGNLQGRNHPVSAENRLPPKCATVWNDYRIGIHPRIP
jgi:hypothetical protein